MVRQHGLRAAFVPSLMIVNRESCSLGEFFTLVRRQLLVGRLQHHGWPMVLTHGLITSLLLMTAIVTMVFTPVGSHWLAAGYAAAGQAHDVLDMLIVVGAGIEDNEAVRLLDQVGVGAVIGKRSGVAGGDTP